VPAVKAVVCKRFGGPEVLEVDELPDPSPRSGQLMVEVGACAVSFPDLLMIQDRYQFKPGLPFVPGGEVAGVVRAVGEGVQGFAPGDRVLGSTVSVGGMAELALLTAERTVALPDGADLADVAGLLYGYGTAHHALKDRAGLRPGESLVVLGAAGAVGLAAVEVGRVMGARVIAAASSDEKLELCRRHGAAETINYSREDLKARMRELTGGDGADVVYDPVGGAYAEPAIRSTAWAGRYLVIGFAAGDIPRIPLNLALLRGCSIIGVFWGSFVGREPARHRDNVAELVSWWADGKLRPHTSASYPLEQAGDALRDLAERRALGKVVVTPTR
jgi:NADPH2:quinone reductase